MIDVTDRLVWDNIELRFGEMPSIHTDANTDFIAFFPKLAGDIADALLQRLDWKAPADYVLKEIRSRIQDLRETRPTCRAGYDRPLLPSFLENYAWEAKERRASIETRRQTDHLYCLCPNHRGLLLDELSEGDPPPRTAQSLTYIEGQLVKMGFGKQVDGQRISYICETGGLKLWADVRKHDRIELYIDPAPANEHSILTKGQILIMDGEIGKKQEKRLRDLLASKLWMYQWETKRAQRTRRNLSK